MNRRAEVAGNNVLDQFAELYRDDPADATKRMWLIDRFTRQVIDVHDPDVVETFLSWTADPVLDTVLNLATKLSDERRHHVIHFVEDQLAEAETDLPDEPA